MKYVILGICLMITSGCYQTEYKNNQMKLEACYKGVKNADRRAFSMFTDEVASAFTDCDKQYGGY